MNLIHILDALSSYWSAFLCVNCGNGFNVGYINCDPSQGTSFRTNDNSVWVCRIHSYRSSKGSNKLWSPRWNKNKTKNKNKFEISYAIHTLRFVSFYYVILRQRKDSWFDFWEKKTSVDLLTVIYCYSVTT